MRAFLSYQTNDREVAARVAAVLGEFGCGAFLAHEHIEVSEEWRIEILKELSQADIFVPILSANYYSSIWCKQESGIAAFREMTVLPLSIDGQISQGFISHIQSSRIDPAAPTYANLLPGLAKHDVSFVIGKLIQRVGDSRSYRGAEANFELMLPYVGRATKDQIVELLEVSTKNKQVCHAGICATEYLPPLVNSHGAYMNRELRAEIDAVLDRYKK